MGGSHEHNLLPFGTPQSHPLLSAQSKAVSAANNKERLGECHDILCCRTIFYTKFYQFLVIFDILKKYSFKINKKRLRMVENC